MDGH